MKALQLKGMRFGRWMVTERSTRKQHSTFKWVCRCDCGTIREVSGSDLLKGGSRSCGCINKERIINGNITHGLSKHPAYNTWKSMVRRCHFKNSNSYNLYGERGITVSREWRFNPSAFLQWADENGW